MALEALCIQAFGCGDYPRVATLAPRFEALPPNPADPQDGDGLSIRHRFGAHAAHYLGDHDLARKHAARMLAHAGEPGRGRMMPPVPERVAAGLQQARIFWIEGRSRQRARGSVARPWSNLEIDHNTLSACNHCIGGGASGANTVIDNVRIHDNNFAGNAALWDDTNDDYHRNGIQIIADSSSCTNCVITNLQIYNNIFQGSWSTWNNGGPNQLNSPIFLDDQGGNPITGWKIFNNVFAMAPNDGGGVACSYGPCQSQNSTASNGSLLVNNTFYQASGGGTCIRLDSQSNLTIENNIIAGCGYAYNTHNGSLTSPTIDYNLWYNTAGSPGSGWLWPGPCTTGVGCGFSTWQAAGFDLHGKIGLNPLLDANFRPQSGSPASAGANLSSLCSSTPALCFDKAGVARPATGNWTIGAYQLSSGTITIQPPTVPTVVAVH